MSMADASFQARLQRISTGQGYVAEGLLGGGELDRIRKRQASGKAPKQQASGKAPKQVVLGVVEKKRFPFKKVMTAFLLGVIAFFGGSLAAFHATQGVASDFDQFRRLVEVLGAGGLSAILAFFLLYVSGLRSKMLVVVIVLGFFAAHFAEPHMARAMPVVWTQIYSAEHAEMLKFQAFAQTTRWGVMIPPELQAHIPGA